MSKAVVARVFDQAAAATPDSDSALMERVGAGEAAACRTLVESHLGRCVGLAYRLLGDPIEAEDVAQDAFLRLWRHARRWQPRARLTTWLHRVTYNLCMDRLRARRNLSSAQPPELGPIGNPSGSVQRNQVARVVGDALNSLPRRQRAAIALVYRRELSNIEAAEVMGISVDAVESLLARGRQGMRKRLSALRADLMGEP